MKYLVLRDNNGTERKVEFPKGAQIQAQNGEHVVRLEDSTKGIGLGDVVKSTIELLPTVIRPRHCSKCQKRREVLNKIQIPFIGGGK